MEGQINTYTHTYPQAAVWRPRREEVRKQLGPSVPDCSEDPPNSRPPRQGALGPPRHVRPGTRVGSPGQEARDRGLQALSPSQTVGSCQNGRQGDRRSALLAWASFPSGVPQELILSHHSQLCHGQCSDKAPLASLNVRPEPRLVERSPEMLGS